MRPRDAPSIRRGSTLRLKLRTGWRAVWCARRTRSSAARRSVRPRDAPSIRRGSTLRLDSGGWRPTRRRAASPTPEPVHSPPWQPLLRPNRNGDRRQPSHSKGSKNQTRTPETAPRPRKHRGGARGSAGKRHTPRSSNACQRARSFTRYTPESPCEYRVARASAPPSTRARRRLVIGHVCVSRSHRARAGLSAFARSLARLQASCDARPVLGAGVGAAGA